MKLTVARESINEAETRSRAIYPALLKAGWHEAQIREEFIFTDGRIDVDGNTSKRGKRKKADYVLYYKPHIPVAVVEAKKINRQGGVSKGIQQAIEYAEILDIPLAYSSDGTGFYEHDRTAANPEKQLALEQFPDPETLWQRYKKFKGLATEQQETIVRQNYYEDPEQVPRYYQRIAINRAVEAVAKGQQRILITMATGTGKTYVAFQIIHRLWKGGTKKRILFLADRRALIEQPKRREFRHFGNHCTLVKGKPIDPAYEIYLALYQGLTDSGADDAADAYREFTPDFFDLVVIDECHRGSADEENKWREILDYFHNATHIGLTATPRGEANIKYFGDPIYTYSLSQGISDGFLAPYKILRIGLNVDLEGWRPEQGKTDESGNPVEDRTYNLTDYERNMVIRERTDTIAARITEFLKKTDRMSKTIVFCVDVEHAQRMRNQLAQANADLMKQNPGYVMRITGDTPEGLDNFANPEEPYPVIATTSKLLTTGIDTKTCKVIVLESNINSMIEFKQIIGRGTRVSEDYDKTHFTIIDFRHVTDKFADPDFDGKPILAADIAPDEPLPENYPPPDEQLPDALNEPPPAAPYYAPPIPSEPPPPPPSKTYVNGVNVAVLNQRHQYLGTDGKLITADLRTYTRDKVLAKYRTLEAFLTRWNAAGQKRVLIDELTEQGIIIGDFKQAINKEMDIFDLICHAAFGQPPRTRSERAKQVQKRDFFARYVKVQ